MKKVAALLSLIVFSLTLSAQTFSFKELTKLNKLIPQEQAKWLEEEKSFVFVEVDQGDRIFVDSSSTLDEFIAVGDDVVTYYWFYDFNDAISPNKETVSLMSRDMAKTFNKTWVEEIKDDEGNIVIDILAREKYNQVIGVGSEYESDGTERLNFAIATIED